MRNEVDAPATQWVILSVVGGVVTGIGLIAGLELLGDHLSSHSSASTKAQVSTTLLRAQSIEGYN